MAMTVKMKTLDHTIGIPDMDRDLRILFQNNHQSLAIHNVHPISKQISSDTKLSPFHHSTLVLIIEMHTTVFSSANKEAGAFKDN
jgi:hypothetical protein